MAESFLGGIKKIYSVKKPIDHKHAISSYLLLIVPLDEAGKMLARRSWAICGWCCAAITSLTAILGYGWGQTKAVHQVQNLNIGLLKKLGIASVIKCALWLRSPMIPMPSRGNWLKPVPFFRWLKSFFGGIEQLPNKKRWLIFYCFKPWVVYESACWLGSVIQKIFSVIN